MAEISYLPIPALVALPTPTGLVFAADGNVTTEGTLQPPAQSAELLGLVLLQVHDHWRGLGFMNQVLEPQPRSEPSIARRSQPLD